LPAFILERSDIAAGSAVEPAVEEAQQLKRLRRRLHDGIPKTVVNEHIFVEEGVEVIIRLLRRYLPVPFFEYVKEKSKLLVLLTKLVSVKLLQFESGVRFLNEQILNAVLPQMPLPNRHDILQ
jgi:hypothetical protein